MAAQVSPVINTFSYPKFSDLPIRKQLSKGYIEPRMSHSSTVAESDIRASKAPSATMAKKEPLTMLSFHPWPGEMNFKIKCQDPSDRCPSHARDVALVMETSIDEGNQYDDLYVRASAVYSRPSEVHEPVKRCLNHSIKDKYTNEGRPNKASNHFIWSDYPKSVYEEDSQNGRLSVVTPLFKPQPGSNETLLVYRFMCLNSCINRRPLRIVFSLEKSNVVIGSHSIDVRVCACPARDLALEEKRHLAKKRKREGQSISPIRILSPGPRGGSPSSDEESLTGTRKRRRSEDTDDEDQVEMLPVKGQKMAKTMKYVLEMLMLAQKCMEVHPELLDEVRQESEEMARQRISAQNKSLPTKRKTSAVNLNRMPLSVKLANIKAVMSEDPGPVLQIPATHPVSVTRNITQSIRTSTCLTETPNSFTTAIVTTMPSGSLTYQYPITSEGTSFQQPMAIIPNIHIKDEPA